MATTTSQPYLAHLLGTGAMLVGARDRDDATGTVVKTHALTLLFVPLVALGAYRVFEAADADTFFRERVPLSGFARAWNKLFVLLLVVALGAGGWYAYTNNANYQAFQLLARADRLAADGHATDAAVIYRDVMFGPTKKPGIAARERFNSLALELPEGDLDDAAGVVRLAVQLQAEQLHIVPGLFEHAAKLAGDNEAEHPAGALALLEAVAPIAPDHGANLKARLRLLDRLVKQSPGDVDLSARLALACAEQGDLKRSQAVLAPHEDKLGDRDAAALLGHIYALQGQFARAEKLLAAYLHKRLPQFLEAEHDFQKAYDRVNQQINEDLQQAKADGFDFAAFHAASKAEQDQMLYHYRNRRMREDEPLRDAAERRGRNKGVVQAALTLGAVRLEQASLLSDADARDKALAEAEETYLSVDPFARDSDKYRLSLAKIYYYRGKHQEGRKLIDEFLTQHNRRSDLMLVVAELLREVGAVSEARALLDEAYAKDANPARKQQLAGTRAIMHLDLDDQILWLGRADASAANIQILLSESKAARAVRDGNDAEAERLYKEALAIHERLPKNAGTLNNAALAHFNLYYLTQDPEQFRQGSAKLDAAVALKPTDALLIGNAAGMLMQAAARDVVGSAIDFKALKRTAGLDLLPYLYRDQAGRAPFRKRLRENPALHKAKGYYERLLQLSPARVGTYASLALIYDELEDVEGMRRLLARAEGVKLDLDDYRKQTLERFAGKKEEKDREDLQKSLPRLQEALAASRKIGGPTLAAALARQAAGQIASARYDLPVNADDVVKLADEADAAAPSASTRALRIEARLFRGHVAMTKQDKGYAELAKKTRVSMGSLLMNWAVGQPGRLRELALANADVKEALRLTAEQAKAFPDEAGVGAWALLRAAHPDDAAAIAARLKDNPRQPLLRKLDGLLAPLSAGVTVNLYWWLALNGKQNEAEQMLREQVKRGVPLPEA